MTHVRFYVIMAGNIYTAVFWDVIPYSYECSEGTLTSIFTHHAKAGSTK